MVRTLNAWATRSRGRDAWRAYYATYITSPEWYARRHKWAIEEARRRAGQPIMCAAGCGKAWEVKRDDLHHCDYDRLGDEHHEDLWPMCRACHDALHDLLESTKSWRKLPRRMAGTAALAVLIQHHGGSPNRTGVGDLRSFL